MRRQLVTFHSRTHDFKLTWHWFGCLGLCLGDRAGVCPYVGAGSRAHTQTRVASASPASSSAAARGRCCSGGDWCLGASGFLRQGSVGTFVTYKSSPCSTETEGYKYRSTLPPATHHLLSSPYPSTRKQANKPASEHFQVRQSHLQDSSLNKPSPNHNHNHNHNHGFFHFKTHLLLLILLLR
jgi:hypothetical protein